MLDELKYGILLKDDAKLYRQYFREAVKLIGIHVLLRIPVAGKKWTTYGEIDTNFQDPVRVGCVFHDHPDQRTLKKMGWMSELNENSVLIDMDYGLPLEVGSLVFVPSGLDDADNRMFRIVKMKNSIVYPGCITCEISPEFTDVFDDENFDFTDKNHPTIAMEEDHGFVPYRASSFIDET